MPEMPAGQLLRELDEQLGSLRSRVAELEVIRRVLGEMIEAVSAAPGPARREKRKPRPRRSPGRARLATANPPCTTCGGPVMRWGKDANGHQRFRCTPCGSTFADRPRRPLGSMRLPLDRADLCAGLLATGKSARAVARITGHHQDTIGRLRRTLARLSGGKRQGSLAGGDAGP